MSLRAMVDGLRRQHASIQAGEDTNGPYFVECHGSPCTCGASEHNARVDAVLASLPAAGEVVATVEGTVAVNARGLKFVCLPGVDWFQLDDDAPVVSDDRVTVTVSRPDAATKEG